MKLHKLIYTAALCTAALAFAACSEIDEADRFIYVKPADVNRAVLIEDFTGQLCTNCPTATTEIENLIAGYGDTAVIAVGIHSGPMGYEGYGDNIGLLTETGDEYFYHWGITSQPAGIVNRSSGVLKYSDWAAAVRNEISKQASLSLDVSNAYDESNRVLNISVSSLGTNGTTTGKIQVWLVEDDIVAVQLMPDGSENYSYVHNHVFRAAVNGTWGDDFSIAEGESLSNDFTYSIPTNWKPENVSVVAFIYNSAGVQQVTKAPIINDNEGIKK